MSVPWTGFPMNALVDFASPARHRQVCRMETFKDPATASEQRKFFYPWPYVEGLTMAEARNELAFLVTEMDGKPVPKQNGAVAARRPLEIRVQIGEVILQLRIHRQAPESIWEANPGERIRFLGER